MSSHTGFSSLALPYGTSASSKTLQKRTANDNVEGTEGRGMEGEQEQIICFSSQ